MPASSPVLQRLLSLAHLSLIEATPLQLVRTAKAAGFDRADLRLSPATPTDRVYGKAELAELCRALPPLLDDTGLRIWDVEIIRVNDGTKPGDHLHLMEAAAILGAQRMKLVCDTEDHARGAEIVGRLCELAAPFGLTMDLEYMVFSGVKSLHAALNLVAAADCSNLRVLVDALHWVRAGDIGAIGPAHWDRLGYVQLCDGPLKGPAGRDALILEARAERMPPGDGEFPLDQLLEATPPHCVASVEVPLPSGQEPFAHAKRLREAARILCNRHE